MARKTARPRPILLTANDVPPEPRQRRSLDNRKRLKAAALALFGERGYEGTSIDDIAGRAHLAVGGFYLHFRSKRQLLLNLMDDLLQSLSELDLQVVGRSDPRTALRSLLSRAFARDLQYLGAYRAWQEAVLYDPDLADRQRAIHAWTTARIVHTFEALRQYPGARRDVDTAALATVIDTFFWALLAQAPKLSRDELDQRLDSTTHLIFHALFVDTSAKGGKS